MPVRGFFSRAVLLAALPLVVALSACGGGGSDTGAPADPGAQAALTAGQVGQVIAQGVAEADARGLEVTIAVVDRMGNVLGVFETTGMAADRDILIDSNRAGNPSTGLEGVAVPADAAAIAKAITAAYLSTSGHAFTTRTANQIVQEHFNPGVIGTEAGPLFGVQFSQLPCSDFVTRGTVADTTAGPKRSPLGLAADPGGLPLYIGQNMVGGVGVIIQDDDYTTDPNTADIDIDLEEVIALAAQAGFTPPNGIFANQITVEGRTFRYTDASAANLATDPAAAPTFPTINGVAGNLRAVNGYFDGVALAAGTMFNDPASGFRNDNGEFFANPDAHVLVDDTNTNRFPPQAGTDAASLPGGTPPLTEAEVTEILEQALNVALTARAQIRRPLNSPMQVTISVVDTHGVPLGVIRTPDAPIFGADVSLQKARTAAFFSNPDAAADLTATPANVLGDPIAVYVTNAQTFLGPGALTGQNAFTDRANGNLSRPYFPDGQPGNPPGPFSRPIADWSPFSTGLQLDLLVDNLVQHLTFLASGNPADDTPAFCTQMPAPGLGPQPRVANGIQIFPGSVPIYRGGVLVGGIGVSGDGVDQDDMVSFLGVHRAGIASGGTFGNAPQGIRADTLAPFGVPLRYIQCPFAPFLINDDDNVCQGL